MEDRVGGMGKFIRPFFLEEKTQQDPLFLFFLIKFDFFSDSIIEKWDKGSRVLYDNLGANFLNANNESSISKFYQEIDATYRGLRENNDQFFDHASFVASLKNIQEKTPWYFTSVTGLDKLLQYNTLNSYWGGDDSIITVNCLESIDFRITSLMQMYRNLVWDDRRWAWIVPQNMRQFNVDIWVTDIRPQTVNKIFEYEDSMFAAPSRAWIKFQLGNCEFKLDSGSNLFNDVSSSTTEQAVQSFSFSYENVKVSFDPAKFIESKPNVNLDYLNSELDKTEDSPLGFDAGENRFSNVPPQQRFLSKGWIKQTNQKMRDKLEGKMKREWENFKQDSVNRAKDTARGLVNGKISHLEDQAKKLIPFDNLRFNPFSLANNAIQSLNDLSSQKSRQLLNNLLNSSRNQDALKEGDNVYSNLNIELEKKLQGYNNFINSNPTKPGPLGQQNVYDPG